MFKASTIAFTSYTTIEKTIEALHEDGCSWFLFGEEKCPSTGRDHLQGMASHKKTVRWSSVRKLGIHTKKCMDPIASIDYCSGFWPGKTPNKVTEFGDRPVFDKKKRALLGKHLKDLSLEEWEEMKPREIGFNYKAR